MVFNSVNSSLVISKTGPQTINVVCGPIYGAPADM
jgi:hypothetical protein